MAKKLWCFPVASLLLPTPCWMVWLQLKTMITWNQFVKLLTCECIHPTRSHLLLFTLFQWLQVPAACITYVQILSWFFLAESVWWDLLFQQNWNQNCILIKNICIFLWRLSLSTANKKSFEFELCRNLTLFAYIHIFPYSFNLVLIILLFLYLFIFNLFYKNVLILSSILT